MWGCGCPLVSSRRHESQPFLPLTTNEASPSATDSSIHFKKAKPAKGKTPVTCAAPPACAPSGVGGWVDGCILVIDLELKTSKEDLDETNKTKMSKHATWNIRAAAVMFTFTRWKQWMHHHLWSTAFYILDMDNKRPRRPHTSDLLPGPLTVQRPAIMSLQSQQIIRWLRRCLCTDMANKDKRCPW